MSLFIILRNQAQFKGANKSLIFCKKKKQIIEHVTELQISSETSIENKLNYVF